MHDYPGFIFNLGHGITPNINPNKVQIMIDAIRQ
jgi:uroporphyrinogen decarboxylase